MGGTSSRGVGLKSGGGVGRWKDREAGELKEWLTDGERRPLHGGENAEFLGLISPERRGGIGEQMSLFSAG